MVNNIDSGNWKWKRNSEGLLTKETGATENWKESRQRQKVMSQLIHQDRNFKIKQEVHPKLFTR